ncbi:MAG: PQQ-dependent sugar dehydrogenase [Isosphaeraceae bacterium]
MIKLKLICTCIVAIASSSAALAEVPGPGDGGRAPVDRVLTGKEALGDFSTDAPGVRRRITTDDLAPPYETPSVDNGPRQMIKRPEGAWPRAPHGFQVSEFATGLNNPRKIVTSPNGDIFVAESMPGRVRVLRDADGDGKPEINEVFASRLSLPFGIAFYPPGPEPTHVYIANTDSVVRFPYKKGDTKASSAPEMIVPNLPGFGRLRGGGHWTRDVVFSLDGKRMFVSVGSLSNVDDNEREKRRADILVFTPEGKDEKIFAWGIRNAVGLAVHPDTGELWASVNERDALGDHLVPDYITHVQEGGFYGWPWYYIGAHQDPRHEGKRPELKEKVIVPDVLLQSHSASLCMTFYTGESFPRPYHKDAFAAEHGSWNRARRTGYKIIRVPMKDGKATGEYEDFLVGFITRDGQVWGRPVGVAVAKDGALLVTDDGSGTIWRVSGSPDK